MYCLEESQLVEDTIRDKSVLNLYKQLLKYEASNDGSHFLDIAKDVKFETLVGLIVQTFETNGTTRLTPEQKAEVCQKLNLGEHDVSSLILIIAAVFTQLFVIDNFLGGHANHTGQMILELKSKFDSRSLCTEDGSEVYHLVINPYLLKVVQLSWLYLSNFDKHQQSRRSLELEFLVWKHRYLTIHLSMLHESSEPIVNEMRKLQEFIFDQHIINDLRENQTQLTRFNIVSLCCELIQSGLMRDGFRFCNRIFNYASELAGVSIEHTGVLGKRTKFQQKDIPQLLIQVTKSGDSSGPHTYIEAQENHLPKDVKLDDDTLLPDISFVTKGDVGESTRVDGQKLSVEEQLLLLTNLNYILKAEVMEESLKDEWTLAYVRSIIKSSTVWSIKYKALAIRSTVEKKHMRKMDRALLQLEELLKETSNQKVGVVDNLMHSFYSVLPLSKWQTQRSLGDISFDLGLFKNALEVYTKIEYWEGIIKCHGCLGETVKAEQLIRQELTKNETPYLYCLLGDATEDIQYYEKSWSLSKQRFARAKKSIGTHYYVRKNYEKAIDNYEQALTASPSNISILSLLAYSCLILERYERAAECYRNISYQDDTSFLVWNNLSKAYIKLNQKERAWRTLREAIKCNYEAWKVWDNFMIVSLDIGALDDVITAWHRLLDLKSSHKDDQVLGALTHSLLKKSYGQNENSPQELTNLLGEAIKLIARLISTGSCSPRVFICYFRLLVREYESLKDNKAPSDHEQFSNKTEIGPRVGKIINCLQRATPTSFAGRDPHWFQSLEKVDEILDDYDELIECYALAFEVFGARSEIYRQWKSFKLSIGNALKVLKQKGYNCHN